MKKRAKLITTIASLCLAVALMAFGVYAASTVTFGVTSTVSFTANDVYVTIAGNVVKNASDSLVGATTLDTYGGFTSYTSGTPNTPNQPGTGTLAATAWTIGNQDLDSANTYIIYTITITNDDGKAIDITVNPEVTGNFATGNMTRVRYQYVVDTGSATDISTSGATVSNVAVNSTVTFTYVARITNAAADVSAFQIDLGYSIAQYVAPQNP